MCRRKKFTGTEASSLAAINGLRIPHIGTAQHRMNWAPDSPSSQSRAPAFLHLQACCIMTRGALSRSPFFSKSISSRKKVDARHSHLPQPVPVVGGTHEKLRPVLPTSSSFPCIQNTFVAFLSPAHGHISSMGSTSPNPPNPTPSESCDDLRQTTHTDKQT